MQILLLAALLTALSAYNRGIPAVRCDVSTLPSVYFLLTSTPDRASRLPRVFETLQAQTLQPKGVILTVARRYNTSRFSSETFPERSLVYTLPARSALTPLVPTIYYVAEDKGPLLKYYGATRMLAEEPGSWLFAGTRHASSAIVVIGDDDVFYGSTFLEDFACSVHSGPANTVYSNQIDADCKWLGGCVMGFRGVAMRASMLEGLEATFLSPSECFLADDVAITYWLTMVKKYTIQKLQLRTRHKLDKSFAESNSSIHQAHKSVGFRINRACQFALKQCKMTREAVCQRDVAGFN